MKVGILDDMNHFSGEHAWMGAELAAKEINEAGGINIDGTQYYIGLVANNTYETESELDISKALNAANDMIIKNDPFFIIGGYNTNALIEYLEPIMDAKIPFIGTGCSGDNLTQNVLDNYMRYKYFFRAMPLNGTSIGAEFITYLIYLANFLTGTLGKGITKFALLYEDIDWTSGMVNALRTYLPYFGFEIVEEIAFPLSATPEDFINYWSQIDDAGAQLVVPLTTADIGGIMAQTYGVVKPKCLMVGIDVLAQLEPYWSTTNGGCQYEIILQSTYNTSKTPLTVQFWNNYIEEYGHEPAYTGIGSYDAIYLLTQAVNNSQSFDPDIIVSEIEKINVSNPFTGVGGNIAFTNSHDLRHGPSYSVGLFCQWQENGNKVVLPTGSMIYPDSWATGTLMIPEWGINQAYPYTVPGVSEIIPPDQLLKIGLLDDMNHFSGEHAWNGALLATREINKAGGINIEGTQYYIGLVAENTYEAQIEFNKTKSIIAANRIINDYNPHFIIGGYNINALIEYIEPIMDANIPFIGTGCSSENLSQNVLDNYMRYKYFFRAMPLNGSSIAKEILTYLYYLPNYLTTILGKEVTKFALLYEDIDWTSGMVDVLRTYLPAFGFEIVEEIAFPLSATPEDFTNYWNQIDDAGAQLVVPLTTADIGGIMAQTYGVVKPKCLMVGIDVPAQLDPYWSDTNGGCQYEIVMQSIYNTSKTTLTMPFWNNFFKEYGHEPAYTGIGSYDAIYLLTQAVNNSQSFDPDIIVSELEKINASNPSTGVGGNIAFTSSHDLLYGPSYSIGLFCQWQENGNKVVLPTGNTIYSDSWATGTLMIPDWGINPIELDEVPPETSIDVSGILGFDGWYLSDITVQLAALDEESGVAYTEYSFDEVNWIEYTEPIVIIDDGITTLYYRSVDNEGNIEDTKLEEFVKYPRPDDVYIVGTRSDIYNLDPHNSWDTESVDVTDQTVESLFAYNLSTPNCEIIPRLASDLGTWSIDGLNYTITLKRGITFHDGTTFNASSVKWNFDRIAYFMNISGTLPIEVGITQLKTLFSGYEDSIIINRTEVVDTYTIKFVLNRPYVPLESLLASWATGILSPFSTPFDNYIDKNTGVLVGTGPFEYIEYQEDVGERFHAYENYWQGPAKIEDLWFLTIPDSAIRSEALVSGIIDFLDTPLTTMLEPLEIDPNFTVVGGQYSIMNYLGMNNNHINKTLRQAISYAIDYDYIIDTLLEGQINRLKSIVPEGILYANGSFNAATMNVTKAREILVDGGVCNYDVCDDSEWLNAATMNPIANYLYVASGNINSVNIGNLLPDNLKLIGINVSTEEMNWGDFLNKLLHDPNSVDLHFFGWIPDINDPSNFITPFCSNKSNINFALVNDPHLEDLMAQGLAEIDPIAREAIYDEIQRYLVEDLMPYTYLFSGVDYDVYNSRFTGYQWNPLGKKWFYSLYPSGLDLTPPSWYPDDDTIPDESTIYYTQNPQIIGTIKIHDSSQITNVQLVNMDPPYNGQPDEGFSLSITHYPKDSNEIYKIDIVVLTTKMLERGVHHLKLIFYDEQGNYAEKSFNITVYRRLELKLSGEFDYLEAESIKFSIAAYLIDVETGDPITPTVELPLIVKIYLVDPDGDILNTLEMEHIGLGVYRYVAEWTIEQLQFILTKGIYLVYGFVDFNSDNHYYSVKEDMIQFHIDPPSGTEPNSWITFVIGSFIGIIILVLTPGLIFLKKHRKELHL
ncbi:MAG: ABC transporter substrate-binding protein [Promethearchaeota archaeon]